MADPNDIAIDLIQTRLVEMVREAAQLQAEIATLTARKSAIDDKVHALEKAVEVLKGETVIEKAITHNGEEANGRYSGMTLKNAVLDVVERFSGERGISPKDILEHLGSQGFKSGAKKPYYSVYGVARDLAEEGKIRKLIDEDHAGSLFAKNQPF